ncbi:RUN [Ceraceosorus bombacis]|uniref:RUN n=1 Tax=Ceraceosorus bombacis TaxID=401625 RepID=A0A0P1BA69_9BASI|nr:RUN [Ceraceosorus bombacis]
MPMEAAAATTIYKTRGAANGKLVIIAFPGLATLLWGFVSMLPNKPTRSTLARVTSTASNVRAPHLGTLRSWISLALRD